VTDQAQEQVEVRLVWTGVDEQPVVAANQFVISHNPTSGETILIIGHVAPPVLTGTPEEQREQAKAIQSVPVRAIARLALTGAFTQQLLDGLTEHITRFSGDA